MRSQESWTQREARRGSPLRTGVARLTLLWALTATGVEAQAVDDRSFVTSGGEPVQRLETVLDAPVAEVWALLTTSEGLRSWMAPVVEVELRNGGRWEASYDVSKRIGDPGNIVNEVVAYVPEKLLVLRVESAPPGYPLDLDLVRSTRAIFELEPVEGDRTRLSVTGVGYGGGTEWDTIYRVGLAGNRASLLQLHERIMSGPTDWTQR